jgi:hypothetical protein
MDWQLASVIVAVSAAVLYLAWTAMRTWRGDKAGCTSACARGPKEKNTPGGFISSDELTLRQSHAKK